MLTEHAAMYIDDVSGVLLHQFRLLKEPAIILVWHEADFHALFFVCRLKVALARDLARIALRQLAQREERARQLLLPQRKQKIALVLTRILALLQQMPSRGGILLDARKMAGGNEL